MRLAIRSAFILCINENRVNSNRYGYDDVVLRLNLVGCSNHYKFVLSYFISLNSNSFHVCKDTMADNVEMEVLGEDVDPTLTNKKSYDKVRLLINFT